MQLRCAAAGLAVLAAAASAQQPTLSAPSAFGWDFDAVNSDNFGGNQLASGWSQQLGDWIGTAPAAFQDRNAVVGGGQLTLSTVSEPGFTPDGEPADCDCGFKDMSTGMVVSAQQMQYGFFEVRARFAQASLLSSFWLQGSSSEINAFEAVPAPAGDASAQKLRTNYHCFQAGGDPNAVEDGVLAAALPAGFDASQFHVYGIDWSADRVVYYVDGAEIRTLSRTELAAPGCLAEPMNVVLSLETAADEEAPTNFDRHDTEFDYFRHWTRAAPTAQPTANPTANPTPTPTANPTPAPTLNPTANPTPTPTANPTAQPTANPTATTARPTTADPTPAPTATTARPTTADPTPAPTTTTARPTTAAPTAAATTAADTTTEAPGTDSPAQSERTCDELGWRFRHGNADTCGASRDVDNQCRRDDDAAAAAQACDDMGARLCTAGELRGNAARGTGCGHDNRLTWTSDSCATDAGAAGFLAVRGRSGARANLPDTCFAVGSTGAATRCCADRVVDRPPPPPAPQQSCADLGWKFRYSNRDVCGSSHQGFGAGGASACLSARSHDFSKLTCSSAGGRLCTAEELGNDATRGTGCGHDRRLVWSADSCVTGAGAAGFMALPGLAGRRNGPQPQCLPADDTTPAVRCCSDKVVVAASRGSVGLLVEGESQSGNVHAQFAGTDTDPALITIYDESAEAAAYEKQDARTAMLQADPYAEDSGGDGGAGGSSGGSSGAAGTAGAAMVAVVAAGLLVGAAVMRQRKQQQQQQADVESGAVRRRSSGGGEFDAAVAAVTKLDAPADAVDYREAVDAIPEATEVPAPSYSDFDANGFTYDDAGSLRLKSVRRANPAYTQSVYSMADVVGTAGVEEKSEI